MTSPDHTQTPSPLSRRAFLARTAALAAVGLAAPQRGHSEAPAPGGAAPAPNGSPLTGLAGRSLRLAGSPVATSGTPATLAPAVAESFLRPAERPRLNPAEWSLIEIGPTGGQVAEAVPLQIASAPGGRIGGSVDWLLPPGQGRERRFVLATRTIPFEPVMQVRRDEASGRWDIREGNQKALSYHYRTVTPLAGLLSEVDLGNRKYARSRSDYIHPLYGPGGEVLTRDWPPHHPHHRGIYWAWPEVDYRGERGDLHALQRVFARPTGRCTGRSGPLFAEIDAENLWLWEDRQPVVREEALIRAWRADSTGRFLDLDLRFTALDEPVAIARRETRHYGGLNIRLAPVNDQVIRFHTDPAGTNPRAAWADLAGTFAGASQPSGLAVFQCPANPGYPGEWVKYPELNWFQPTFPASGTRYVLKKDQTLRLRFRLRIHRARVSDRALSEQWAAYATPPEAHLEPE
jgi:Family of unknown function (DUF6807)